MIMNAVGIDVSKRKSTVVILRPVGKVVVKSFGIPHLSADLLHRNPILPKQNKRKTPQTATFQSVDKIFLTEFYLLN